MTTTDGDDYPLAQAAMAIAERILDHPDDHSAVAAGKAFLHAHADAVARTRHWRAERAARPVDPVQRARIDRELADQYGPDIGAYLARDLKSSEPFPGVSDPRIRNAMPRWMNGRTTA